MEEYLKLLKTPCLNEEVREAHIVSCYTGLRWVDTKLLNWLDIGKDTIKTRLIQAKTGEPVILTIRRFIFIADRGLFSFDNLQHIREQKGEFIVGLRMGVMKEKLKKTITILLISHG